jgi:hypothetical protein
MFVFEQLELTWREVKGMTINVPPSMSRKKTGLMGRVGEKCTKQTLVFHRTSLHHPPDVTLWRRLNMTIKVVFRCECHLILDIILSLPVFSYVLNCWGRAGKVSEKRICRGTFELKREEVTGSWRKLHNGLHNVYISPVSRLTKLRISDG